MVDLAALFGVKSNEAETARLNRRMASLQYRR
jgi:hypothetical protein